MPAGVFNQNWLDQNANRKYPLAFDATAVDTSGTFTIPDSLLLSMYFPVSAGETVKPENFYLRSIAIFATGMNISLAYDDGSSSHPIVATAIVSFSSHSERDVYTLTGAGDFIDSVGRITVGETSEIQSLPAGQYLFTYEAGKLDLDVIRPILQGITGFYVTNGTDTTSRLTGDVEFVAGENTRLSVTTVNDINKIRIDAIQGEGLNDKCPCEEVELPCIKTINGIQPDSEGNFEFLGDDCISWTNLNHGLKADDTCSAPCCGCAELEKVTRDLEKFGQGASRLEAFINRLESTTTEFNNLVLGSKLNDTGCIE